MPLNVDKISTGLLSVNGNEITGELPYKIYTALLTQLGTNAPVPTILENTLDNSLTFSRSSPGVFTITGTNLVDETKVYVDLKYINVMSTSFPSQLIWFTVTSGVITINTVGMNLNTNSITPTDNILDKTPIEIKVYN